MGDGAGQRIELNEGVSVMSRISALRIAVLLCLTTPGLAATVQYQHPDLTIAAKDEPLESVLSSIAREMQIRVRTPPGLNPLISADIQSQPITQAFKDLLRGLSYTLEWEEKGQRLARLTILTGGDGAAVASVSSGTLRTASESRTSPAPVSKGSRQGADRPVKQSSSAAPSAAPDRAMVEQEGRMAADRAEHESRMMADRAEHEARMVTERAAMEARMAEERVVEEARMREEAARVEAEELEPD
jgi:hypothetical protein